MIIDSIYETLFRIYRIIGRILIQYSSNPRPSSYPYITGDGFRNIADHIYDKAHMVIQPHRVKERDVVFVGDENIKNFLRDIHPKIKERYILITHNGDEFINEEVLKYVDEKIIKWYGINVGVKHPKVTPLPLGIANKHFYVTGIPWIFTRVAKKNYPKQNKIFYGFTTWTNILERQSAFDVLVKHPLAETVKKWVNFNSYLNLLATYKFVVSPPGSSVEGHRTWEALYIGIVPIVKSSITIDYFESLGMPLWVVHDWKELESVDEKILETKFREIMHNVNRPPLFMDYWIDKIRNTN